MAVTKAVRGLRVGQHILTASLVRLEVDCSLHLGHQAVLLCKGLCLEGKWGCTMVEGCRPTMGQGATGLNRQLVWLMHPMVVVMMVVTTQAQT